MSVQLARTFSPTVSWPTVNCERQSQIDSERARDWLCFRREGTSADEPHQRREPPLRSGKPLSSCRNRRSPLGLTTRYRPKPVKWKEDYREVATARVGQLHVDGAAARYVPSPIGGQALDYSSSASNYSARTQIPFDMSQPWLPVSGGSGPPAFCGRFRTRAAGTIWPTTSMGRSRVGVSDLLAGRAACPSQALERC